ncbi:MAG: type II CAAX endopeptidase family protein [Puia sp.]|nr:type II CAAX endopeptidase family protein [Puia sp.]
MPVILTSGLPEKKPLLEQGWLRVLLFGICFLILTVAIAIPAVLVFADMKMDEIAEDPLHLITNLLNGKYLWLIVSLEWIVSMLSVLLFRLFVDRRSVGSLGLRLPGYWRDAAAGFFTGTALLGLGALILFLSGHFHWTDIDFDGPLLLKSVCLLLVIAFSEELVFRGYVLNNLLQSFDKWTALIVSAILFAGFHITNPSITPLAFVNLALAGVLMGINYIYSGNLWYSILLHFSWNFFQGPLMGFRVSGLSMPAILQLETKGDLILTGGDFGLEGSVLITAITIIAILLLNIAFGKRYKGA